MSNPTEEPDIPEVIAVPEGAEDPDEAVGDFVDDPMIAEEDK
jgi:hypothetical protein